ERVRWAGDLAGAGSGEAADLVRKCLEQKDIRNLFTERPGVEVHRELPLEVILDGAWMSGIVDRLHIERDAAGAVKTVVVFDFKTDAVEDPGELVERYEGQMEAYRRALAEILGVPGATIRCLLVWTKGMAVVEV
ncbi:MAG: hypothetical protein HKO57_09035, partial [Akkermansiaceae bacterium]|nr:hypothetical protein [Akkermansiaceae bacterium]